MLYQQLGGFEEVCVQYISGKIEPGHDKEQTNKMTYAPSEDTTWVFARSDQSSLCALWVAAMDPNIIHADWVDTQADLGLRWAHM